MESLPMLSVQVAGGASLLIGLGHLGFPRVFDWRADLDKISPITARVFLTLHAATIALLVTVGGLSVRYARELSAQPGLALAFCASLSVFWLWRLGWQLSYFRLSALAHTRRHTVLHLTLIVVCSAIALGYAVPVVRAVQVAASSPAR